MKLIVMTGLPATGKSTIAEALGRELAIPVFALDWLRGVLRRHEIDPEKGGFAAYEMLVTLARRQLMLGQSAILDSVLTPPAIRGAIRDLAMDYHVPIYGIWTHCSDESLHKARLLERKRGIPNWPELQWEDVQAIARRYSVWEYVGLRLDMAEPFERNLKKALKFVSQYDEAQARLGK
jgi:predicted kinase